MICFIIYQMVIPSFHHLIQILLTTTSEQSHSDQDQWQVNAITSTDTEWYRRNSLSSEKNQTKEAKKFLEWKISEIWGMM